MLTETCVPCEICPNAKEHAGERLARTPCSPSLLPTPETDALHAKQGLTHAEYRKHAQRLERERDMARAAANTFRQCAELTFGVLPFPRNFHWENAEVRHGAKDAELD